MKKQLGFNDDECDKNFEDPEMTMRVSMNRKRN